MLEHERARFVIEHKASGSAASVGTAVQVAKDAARRLGSRSVPMVVVPFMGPVGKKLCAESEVSWLDLSGNADIRAPGIRIFVEGKDNQFVHRGRPSSAFAPKSARVARHMLIEPDRWFRQQDLAKETQLDDGFTSRIVRRLVEDGLVDRNGEGLVKVREPGRLLDAWSEVYDFNKHRIIRGHITARSGDGLADQLGSVLAKRRIPYAATGLAAAWAHTQFAGFRVATFYVASELPKGLLTEAGFREEPRGANVWLVDPNDDGVFDGATTVNGLRVAHPIQTYLDLGAHAERAVEAAAELRTRLFKGSKP